MAELPSSPYGAYAEAAFATYLSNMYDAEHGWLRLQYGLRRPSNYWNSAVAFHTLLQYDDFHRSVTPYTPSAPDALVRMVEQLVQTERRLNESDSQLRNQYNDDMAWMVAGLTSLYDHTGNSSHRDAAVLLFDTIRQSDDDTCCGDMPGGVWWDLAHSSKATAAQAGVTVAALRLLETAAPQQNRSYWLEYAASHFAFWRVHMVDNSTGQVCDSIGKNGRKSWWSFTYNNGLMLGAAVHLYAATGDAAYLDDAALLAAYLMHGLNVTVHGRTVSILTNDCAGGCDDDSSQFHQVGFQYLTEYYRLLLQTGSTDAACTLLQFLQDNMDSLWINARDGGEGGRGTFNCNWDSRWDGRGRDGLQGSMNTAMSALSLFANLPVQTVELTEKQ